jgi:hypothetical protein
MLKKSSRNFGWIAAKKLIENSKNPLKVMKFTTNSKKSTTTRKKIYKIY